MTKLIATTAALLLAGTALAAAQGMSNKSEGAATAPSNQHSGPAEKMAPAQAPSAQHQKGAQSAKPAQTTGQAAGEDKRPGKAATDTKASTDMKADQKSSMDKSKMDTKSSAENKAGAETKMDNKSASDSKASDQKSAQDHKAGDQKSAQDNKTSTKTTTSGQGAAGAQGKANLSSEQRTKIRTVIKEKVKVEPLSHVNFSVSVGTVVPRTVHFYPLPAEVIAVYPQWRGYDFIVVGNQIIIIEPSTYEIVYIIA